MKYIKLFIAIADEYQEPLIAELSEMEFDGFQQLENELVTYIAKERFHIGDREHIEQLLSGFPGNGYIQSEEVVADQNWNAEWEKTIQAQQIGPFLVKPTWSAERPVEDQILLEIDPKMSFGTGYHETTQLMLRQLPDIISENDRVMDAGTGTGILAIAAIKLGASAAVAFDIDDWSVTNTRENIYLNEVSDQITVKKGTHEVIDSSEFFDVILANIHLNVISEMIPFFAGHLQEGGQLLLSGLVQTDESKIRQLLKDNNLKFTEVTRENEWIAIRGGK